MPRIKNDSICVFPTYKVKGDIDKKIGNIEYNGSIYIEGNVLEGIKIIAGKEIIIKGNVNQSEIYSNSDINVSGNVIGSNLVVGAETIIYMSIYNYLNDIKDYLLKLYKALTEIIHSKNNEQITLDKFSKIFKILIISKFKNEKDKINETYNNLINLPKIDLNLKKQLQTVQNQLQSMEISGDANLINNAMKYVDSLLQNIAFDMSPANIYVMYCQNSNIISTNNVEILGSGCYNTNINAENSVIFKQTTSVLRGGKIEAKKYIKVSEVGSTLGVTTTLKTTKEGVIEADVAYQNTILIFDEIKFKIDEPVKKLKAYIKRES
ncbi:FapA family protein [Caloramator sp. mosi_1]|uniref:FapA family protein n=1 Tax=Caloramator sp. mosi_1 TaxID=3023090 RepID=UPI003081F2FE